MSPMSTAAMNSVDRTKAGVASGVLSMSRMVGGTVGLALMGALITTIGGNKLDQLLPHAPAATRTALTNALGEGGGAAHTSAQIVSASHEAFVSALSASLTVGGAVTLIGAVVAWRSIEPMAKRAAAPAGSEAVAAEASELTTV
jgi:hypothetical protein